jgi:hypothetical protein
VLVSDTDLPNEPGPIPVDPARWRSALPTDAWPADFGSSGQVWRQDVFAIANGWCEGTVSTVRFVTAVLAWGNGIRGYGPYRTGAVLTQSGASDRLESALAGLRHDAPSVETVVDRQGSHAWPCLLHQDPLLRRVPSRSWRGSTPDLGQRGRGATSTRGRARSQVHERLVEQYLA